MWKVYCYTTPSNKKYIGITQYSLKQRMKSGYNEYFSNAIKKYGLENINSEILRDDLTFEEATELERYYIHLYNTTNKDKGYNITYGGEGSRKYDYFEVIDYYKNSGECFKDTLKYLGCSSKTLLNILEGAGYNRKELISKIDRETYYNQGKNTPVLQYDLKGNFIKEYKSIKEAADAVGLKSPTSIFAVCEGKRNKTQNYFWRFKEGDSIPFKIEIVFSSKHWKVKIGQYDKQTGQLLNIYNSIVEANLSLGKEKNNSSITAVCKGRRKSAFGYVWKYEEED